MSDTLARPQDDEQRQLEHVRVDLIAEFGTRVPAEQVTARFDAIVAEYEDAPIRSFIPVLARRRTRQELASQG